MSLPTWNVHTLVWMRVCQNLGVVKLWVLSLSLETMMWISFIPLHVDVKCRWRVKIFQCVRKMWNSNFHCRICIQHEKCINMSTNKPSIGSVVLKIVIKFFKMVRNFNISYYLKPACKALRYWLIVCCHPGLSLFLLAGEMSQWMSSELICSSTSWRNSLPLSLLGQLRTDKS